MFLQKISFRFNIMFILLFGIFISVVSCTSESEDVTQVKDDLYSEEVLSDAFTEFIEVNSELFRITSVNDDINTRMVECGPGLLPNLECNIAPQDFTFTVNHPDGCNVDVTLRVKPCVDFTATSNVVYMTFTMVNYEFLNLTPGTSCYNWLLSIINLPPTQANEKIDLFLEFIKSDAERQFMTAWILANPNSFPCAGSVLDLQAAFFSAACTQRCLFYDKNDPLSSLMFTDEPCDEEGCCLKITEWCENGNGTVGNGGGSALQLLRKCDNIVSPIFSSCKKGIVWGEDCREKIPNCSK